MSRVVLLELRKQFQDEIEEHNRELKKIIKDSNRLKISEKIDLIDISKQLKIFDNFYEMLGKNVRFDVLQYKNEYLPDIVERAVYRRKPFTNEKTELKDALIWKTYSEFVETNNLQKCILLTNNTSDFCDKQDCSKVHSELLKDTDRFLVINSTFAFYTQKGPILESPEHKLQLLIEQVEIDESYVREIIVGHFDDILADGINEMIEGLSPSDIIKDEFYHDGYVTAGGEMEILEASEIEHEILGHIILVSGKIRTSRFVEAYEYNVGRDPGEDQYISVADKAVTFEVYFNFNLSSEQVPSDFEIIEIKILSTSM
jgi:hypothetical protein